MKSNYLRWQAYKNRLILSGGNPWLPQRRHCASTTMSVLLKASSYLLKLIFVPGCFIYLLFTACGQQRSAGHRSNNAFLFKSPFDTSSQHYGAHIEMKQILPKDTGLIKLSIDDRDAISRSGYSRAQKLSVLGEY